MNAGELQRVRLVAVRDATEAVRRSTDLVPFGTGPGAVQLAGARLSADLADACCDGARVGELLRAAVAATPDAGQAVAVLASALSALSQHVVGLLLRKLELHGDWEARVTLAEGSRNLWTASVSDLVEGGAL